MSKQTAKNLLITTSMTRMYKQLLIGVASYEDLGSRIIQQIKAAHAFRQIEQVKELASILINIPIREHQLIAQYYLIWCKCREYEYPAETLERIIEQSQTYKTKALFSRAAIEVYQGNLDHAAYFYNEALKTSPTISEYIDLSRSIAGLKSLEGFHQSALRDLENLVPLIRHAEPRLHYDFLNSYAVELGEVGRTDEAENVSRLTVASPFAPYYPEWQSTYSEIRSSHKRRSTITVSRPQIQQEPEMIESIEPELLSNIVQFPLAQPTASDFETTIDTLTTDGIVFTPLQLLGIILKLVLKNRITDFEIDKITTAYYRAIKDMWGE